MAKMKIALGGVGNCASALIQGAQYYRNASEEEFVPGLLRANFGGYRPRDLEFVAGFDVNADKVGKDLGEAIFTSPNNTVQYSAVPLLGVEVKKRMVMDGLGKYLQPDLKAEKTQ